MQVCIKCFFFHSTHYSLQSSTLEADVLESQLLSKIRVPSQVELKRAHSTQSRTLPCVQLYCRWVDGVKLRKSSSIHYSTQPRFIFSLSPSRSHGREADASCCYRVRGDDGFLNFAKWEAGRGEKRDRTTASLRLRSSGLIYLGWIFGECSSSIVCSRLVSPDAAAALVLQ